MHSEAPEGRLARQLRHLLVDGSDRLFEHAAVLGSDGAPEVLFGAGAGELERTAALLGSLLLGGEHRFAYAIPRRFLLL